MMKSVLFLVSFVMFAVVLQSALGHGVGSETLPPQMMGNKKVAMEVTSNADNATSRKQITFSLFNADSKITIRDVKYHIKTVKNGMLVFEGTFDAKNGILEFDLIPEGSEITIQKKSDSGFLGSLLGVGKNIFEARSEVFKQGGLYKFTIDILEAENYSKSKNKPVIFESGLSFPESRALEVNDQYSGKQTITAITYYETLDSLNYDAKTKSIQFSMPFEWTQPNINQTFVIHQEVVIPKTFDSLQVSKYGATINGIALSDKSITIDDFGKDNRVIHLVVYQADLLQLYDKQQIKPNKIDFAIYPQSDDLLLVSATSNVQYKIALTTKPKHISASQDVLFLFKIYDVFLAEKTVSATYDFVITSGGKELYKTSGKSLDAKDQWNEIRFFVPKDAKDRLVLHFENLGGNKLAYAEIPIILNAKGSQVPSWIKNNAEWWCTNQISDNDFLKGIEYLVAQKVIDVRVIPQNDSDKQVPTWVKNTSCWWAENTISDTEFINSIAFLVEKGTIKP